MRAASPVQVFPNPYGVMREILTARRVWNVAIDPSAFADFTWFAGYAWRIVACGGCRSHLGWIYEGEDEPKTFFGLLRSAIKEGDR